MRLAMVLAMLASFNACTSGECEDFDCRGERPVIVERSLVYVANDAGTTGSVSAYRINGNDLRRVAAAQLDAGAGSLSEIDRSPFAAGAGPVAVLPAVSSGATRFAYVANAASAEISGYAIDRRTGALVPIAGSPFPVASGAPRFIAQGSDSFLYVATQNAVGLYAMDVNTGALRSTGPAVATGSAPSAMAFAHGKFAYVANMASNDISAYSMAGDTRALTPIGTFAAGSAPQALAADRAHKFLYVANSGSNDIGVYSIDADTGALAAVGTAAPTGTAPAGLAVFDQFLFVANFGSNDVRAYAIDATTGALSPAGVPVATGIGPRGPVIQPSRRLDPASLRPASLFLYVANSGSNSVSAYSVDPASGTLTSIGAAIASGTRPVAIAAARTLGPP